jgi:electron transport complex protein RnfB
VSSAAALVDRIDAALPQTQCTRCGYPDCRSYAQAIAEGGSAINRCPPGGAQGVARLAAITGGASLPLDPLHGTEGPLRLARIDESACIGCALCLKACPVDCILGAGKRMHTVIAAQCTGCELCLPACPVDCITLVTVAAEHTGWDAWSDAQAQQARTRYRQRQQRSMLLVAQARSSRGPADSTATADAPGLSPPSLPSPDAKRATIDAALARSRARRAP